VSVAKRFFPSGGEKTENLLANLYSSSLGIFLQIALQYSGQENINSEI
jgi:hypothetical protein